MGQRDLRIGARIPRSAAVDGRAAIQNAFACLKEGLIDPETANARGDLHDVRDVVGGFTIDRVLAQARISRPAVDGLTAKGVAEGGLIAWRVRDGGRQWRLNIVIKQSPGDLE